MATPLSDADFQSKVIKSQIPVLVDFWAPWCGPCKAMMPVIDEITTKYEGKVAVYKVNVDENQESPGKYGVMSIPNFLIFKGGEVVDTFVGMQPKDVIAAKLDAVLA